MSFDRPVRSAALLLALLAAGCLTVLVADAVLMRATFSGGWMPRPVASVTGSDVQCWTEAFGATPPATASAAIVPPPSRGERYAQGVLGLPGGRLPHGIARYDLDGVPPFVHGSVLTSSTDVLWRIHVVLPGGAAIEHTHHAPAGTPMPAPWTDDWPTQFNIGGFALNALLAAGVWAVLFMVVCTIIRRRWRRAAPGRCATCDYPRPTHDGPCPECGVVPNITSTS